MAIDLRKCATIVNPRFIPYLEKHRIYELFYDIGEALAMALPHDYLLFMRKLLADLGEIRGKPRIILIVPPQIDGRALANLIKAESNMRIIGLNDLLREEDEGVITSEELALRFNDIVAEESLAKTGWIIYDFPRDNEEATYLQKQKILPTHTFEICASPDNYRPEDAWCENAKLWKESDLTKAMAEHRRKVFGLHNALRSTYKKVPVSGRSLEELSRELGGLAKVPASKGAPIVPRVVLIGTRGSARRTIASRIKAALDVVHVDLEEMMLGGLDLQNETGERLRRLKDKGVPVFFKIVMSMLEKRLLQTDCMSKGWVMTGFPRDVGDLVALDGLETPPNKVLFLSVSREQALARLEARKVNAYSGKVANVAEIRADPFEDMDEYYTHPRDLTENVLREQEEFAKNVQAMLDYCGENCEILDAEGDADVAAERAVRLIMQPCPIREVRRLKKPEYDKKPKESVGHNALRFTLISRHGNSRTYPELNLPGTPVSHGGTYMDHHIKLSNNVYIEREPADFVFN